jgi:hypothetical protein
MKKTIFTLFLVAILSLSAVVPCFAEGNDATLKAIYSYNAEEDKITVDARFFDIKAKEGIITINYSIVYDPSALELIDYKCLFPAEWEKLLENQMVEDFSLKQEDGKITWSFVVIAVGKGAKKDNELGIQLNFKPIGEGNTDVEFQFIDIGTEILQNGQTLSLEKISGNSAKVNINLTDPAANASEGFGDVSTDENSFPMYVLIIIGVGILGVALVVVLIVKSKKG